MKKTIPPTRSVDFHPASAAKQKLGTERHEVLTPIAAHLLHHGREPGTPSPDGETVVTVMPATGGALATDDEHAAY
ncbi:MAG: hypothetical protein F4X35_03030 [Alphaproteobacteria bacterium]|nr:hypothetical protein [Alphaproteobacteria bacterium]